MTPEEAAQALIDALVRWDRESGDNDVTRLLVEARQLIQGVHITRIRLGDKRAADKR